MTPISKRKKGVQFLGEEKGGAGDKELEKDCFVEHFSCILSASVSQHSFSYLQVFFPRGFHCRGFNEVDVDLMGLILVF